MAIESEKVYFTSDLHFSHGNILKYSNRPFMNEYEQGVVDQYLSDKENEEYSKAYFGLRLSKDTINRHDEALITNWNAKVPKNGIVYNLGDFCFDARKAVSIIDRLNGQIFFIRGNHDKNIGQFQHKFGWVKDLYELKVSDKDARHGTQMIVLCHYAMRVWNKSHHGAYMLHGHSHGSLFDDPNLLSFDVGVDCHDYAPLSYEEVKKIMEEKKYKSVDHHGV